MHWRGRGGLDGYGYLTVRSRAVHGNWGSRPEGDVGWMCDGGTAMRDFWLMHGTTTRATAA